MAERRKVSKRKARLSTEDAVTKADKKRRNVAPYIPKSGLPKELQILIWGPLVREMNVLDLLDLAWTPSWGL